MVGGVVKFVLRPVRAHILRRQSIKVKSLFLSRACACVCVCRSNCRRWEEEEEKKRPVVIIKNGCTRSRNEDE